MQTPSHNTAFSRWRLRLVTFLVAALAAASATYWGLLWSAAAPSAASAAVIYASASPADPQLVARVLGGAQAGVAAAPGPPVDAVAKRFQLTGVVAERSKGGYALIAIDGKPAQPYRVGSRVDDALVVHSVAARSAALAASVDAPVSLTLELPQLK
jgi:general secretion pathway protein C